MADISGKYKTASPSHSKLFNILIFGFDFFGQRFCETNINIRTVFDVLDITKVSYPYILQKNKEQKFDLFLSALIY